MLYVWYYSTMETPQVVEMSYRLPPMPRKKRPEHGKVLPRLNIEVYPDEEQLLRRIKADAALRDQSLHDWVFDALRQRLEETPDGR